MNGNQVYPESGVSSVPHSPSPESSGGRRKEARKRRHTTTPHGAHDRGDGSRRRGQRGRKGSSRSPNPNGRGRRKGSSRSPNPKRQRSTDKDAKLNKGKLAEKFTIKEKLGR